MSRAEVKYLVNVMFALWGQEKTYDSLQPYDFLFSGNNASFVLVIVIRLGRVLVSRDTEHNFLQKRNTTAIREDCPMRILHPAVELNGLMGKFESLFQCPSR
jgi:hypothetical protein